MARSREGEIGGGPCETPAFRLRLGLIEQARYYSVMNLRPVHFDAVVDVIHPVDAAGDFLGHLLLVERMDRSVEHHPALFGLEAKIPLANVRIVFQFAVNSF